nr:hypothetical protein [Tanacetum cinerariifolium]
MLENQENVKSRSDKGYHAVFPPYTGNYIPPKPNLMFIDEQVKSEYVDVVSNVTSSAVKTVESKVEFVDVKNKGVYSTVESKPVKKNIFSPRIIEDWNFDDESEVELEHNVEVKTVRPCIEKKKFVKTARKKVEKDRLKLKELMELSTKLSDRVFDLKKIKTTQAKEIVDLKKRVKKLERKRRYRTLRMNLFKIGTSKRRSLGKDDASKQGRNLIQSGSDHEDANEHIEKVLEIVDLFHGPNITQDQEDLKTKFLSKYCPPARTAKKIEEINNFQQEPNETLYQAWERFKELLMKFPQNYLTEMHEVILFYNGLDVSARQIIDSKAIQAKLNNLGREIKKVNIKVYTAQVGCEQCKRPHYTKDCPLKEEGKTLEEAYYTQFGVPFQQGGKYRAAALGFYQRNNANPSYQERRQLMEESLSKFMTELSKRHEENSNLFKEIRASIDAAIRNQGASIKTLEIQTRQMSKNSKLMFESRKATIPFPSHLNDYYSDETKGFYGMQCLDDYSYGATCVNDSLPQKEKDPGSLGELAHTKLTVELVDRTMKHPKGIVKDVLVRVGKFVFPTDFMILDMPEDVKVPLILRRPFLSTARAKINVFKRKITLRVGDEKIIFKSVKPASSLIKRVYMLSLRERMKLDLEARLMEETLVLNISLDPLYGDYIELNDLNVPLELRRDQVDDLMPTTEEGEVINTRNNESIDVINTRRDQVDDLMPMIDIINTRNNESFDEYPSFCDFDRKIHIDCAYNLSFSCMIVVKNIDGYRDQDIGDVIFGEPFCKALCVEAKRFDGLITIHNGNDNVTYQIARSHPRFKHLSNAQCNKIRPLLKVFLHDELAGKEIDNVGEVSII